MQINRDVIYRNIAGEHVLIPVGSVAMENNGMFVLTDLGGEIWQMLEKNMDRNAMIETLLEEYEVDRKELAADVDAFLQKLIDGGLVFE